MATKQRARKKIHLRETIYGAPDKIDREAGIIRGVRVIGPRSDNNRYYTHECLTGALHLYEGAAVKIDHPPKGRQDQERPIASIFGWLRDAHIDESGAVRADLHYLKTHDLAEQVAETAERNPNLIGFSHNADGLGHTEPDGTFVVDEITELRSVDLVDRPATNKSLFESRRAMQTIKVKAFLLEKVLPHLKGSKARYLKKLLEGMDTLDMPMKAQEEDEEEEPSTYHDHLYQAHKAVMEEDPAMANKILNLLKAEEAEEEVPEMDNLDADIGEEEEEETPEQDEDEGKEGKPNTADPEPDDLKAKESRQPRRSRNPAVRQLQEQVARLTREKDRAELQTWIQNECEQRRLPCDRALLEGLMAMHQRDKIGKHLDWLAGRVKLAPKATGPRSQAPAELIESRSGARTAKEFLDAITN